MMTRLRFALANLLLLLLLIGPLWPSFGQQVAASVEEQKGQIWTRTAQRVWADANLTKPRPQPWKTVQEFNLWLNKDEAAAKKSELGLLLDGVIKRIGPGQSGTPAQVARAIVADIDYRRTKKIGLLARVNLALLQDDLADFAPPGTQDAADSTPDLAASDSATSPATSSATSAADSPRAALALSITEDPQPQPDQTVVGPEYRVASPRAPTASYFEQHPYQTAALGGVLGLLIGAGLMRLLGANRQPSHERTTDFQSTVPGNMTLPEKNLRADVGQLTFKVNELRREITALREENSQLRAQLSGSAAAAIPVTVAPTASEPTIAVPIVAAPPVETSEDPLQVSLASPAVEAPETPAVSVPAAPAPATPLTRYGPVQEAPFLEDRKLTDMPLPQLALMLTVQAQQPDQATFTLNPHVNQEMLIGDGLNRLQKFFDYDPPIGGGRISSVKAAAAGRLQRQAEGWQVVERARLIIN